MDPVSPHVTRAAVWTGTGVAVQKVELPELRDGETLVRISLATVCGSDLHTVSGRRPAACPSVLGHEAVGTVVAGSRFSIGDRVVWSVTVACGRCVRCRAGRSAKCLSVRKVGHEPFTGDWPLSGTYAEYIVLPAGAAIVRVPDSVADAVAAPAACATATVMAAVESAVAAAGELVGLRVLICGAGMLGVTASAVAARAGARVAVRDIDTDRLELAQRFGGEPDMGGPADVVIDFSGSSAAVGAAVSRLDVGGVLVLAGSVLPGPPVKIDPEVVVRQWLTITGVHNYEPRHLGQAMLFLERTRDAYPWRSVVAEPVDLDALGSVLTTPPPGILRCAIRP